MQYLYFSIFVLLVEYIILILLPPLVKESSIEFIEHSSIVKINLEIKPLIIKKKVKYSVENPPGSSRRPLSSLSLFQVNAADHLGQTALHRAARCGHLQTCRLLLSAGADPLLPSLQGVSPSQLGSESMQEMLQGELAGRLNCTSRPRTSAGSAEPSAGSAEPSTSVSAEGVVVANSEVDRQLLEASKTGDLETVKVRAGCCATRVGQ